MLIYIAGCYRAKNGRSVDDHITIARDVAAQVWEAGHYALCPHMNTAKFDEFLNVPDEVFLDGTLEMLRRCDAIVMCEHWQDSEGAVAEYNYARDHGMPIYESVNEIGSCLTEIRCPEQCRSFMDTIMEMYRLHLSKNADYSPANIKGTGEIGILVRAWDKIARLLNLHGFELQVESKLDFCKRSPKHESIRDSWIDLAVYSIIALIYSKGKWGR